MAGNRVKYAYVNYDDIQWKIDSGEIDQYDIVFTKDTHEQYFIKEDLSLLRIISKVYCFDSIIEAEETLNKNTDTYVGQIVAIANDNIYSGYIVNRENGKYTVNSLSDSRSPIDYDNIDHRPVINKIGTQDGNLIIGDLDNGIYSVTGVYKIFNEYPTLFTVASNHLFLVEKTDSISYVKDISAKEIITYTLSNGAVQSVKIGTTEYKSGTTVTLPSYPTSLPASDVPSWAKQKTKPTYSASEIGLGNVGNFKAVSTVASQRLTDTEKSNARANIGVQIAGSYASSTHNHDDKYQAKGSYASASHTHTKSQITDFPTSMPANGGNSSTVNGHTVNSNVPANAKFTDTTYAIATTSANGLMSKDMVTKLNGIASGATAVTSTTVSNWGFKKTDTNTWRGVQNNLTSTATDQSLSAYQGKVLKDLVDTKTTFTYSSTTPTSPASNAVWIG